VLDTRGVVSRIIPFSSVDGPGNRFAVFLQGCALNCHYCHNPETRPIILPEALGTQQQGNPRIRTRVLTAGEIIDQMKPLTPFLRGLTISGGECLLQPDFVTALVRKTRDIVNLGTLLDTCGHRPFADLPEIFDHIEGVMLDVKAWDTQEHQRLTGFSNSPVLENLRWAGERGLLTEVRTVIVPDEFNSHETVKATARSMVEVGAQAAPYVLIRFRPQGVRRAWRDLRPPTDGELNRLVEIAHNEGLEKVLIR